MRLLSKLVGVRPWSTRSVDLKTTLVLHIAVVAMACFALVTLAVLWDADNDARQRSSAIADLAAKHVSLQLLRVNAGFGSSSRYPDWDGLLANNRNEGQCVRLDNEHGALVRNDCIGSRAEKDSAPTWFAAMWSYLSPEQVAQSPVTYKGKSYGKVTVSSDPAMVASRAWNELKHLIILTALTIVALSALVYMALARALAPTQQLIEGLNRLSDGTFSHRLPRFRLSELQRIGEVSNTLAEKIETTLAERAELSRRLMNAQEEERRVLARELHDDLGQSLTAIAALAASIEKSADRACPELQEETRSLSHITRDTMHALRDTLAHLRPADLDKFGLGESLKHLVNVWNASHGRTMRFELNVTGEIGPLSETTALHVFRIAQEGLTNAAKHAHAQKVRLSIEPITVAQPRARTTTGIRLTIEDDGYGRDANGRAPGDGMGLLNMQERVAALGGSILFDDRPGSGLTVRVVIPTNTSQGNAEEHPHD